MISFIRLHIYNARDPQKVTFFEQVFLYKFHMLKINILCAYYLYASTKLTKVVYI